MSAQPPAAIAVDGGGTKTDAVVLAADGTVLGSASGPASNHQLAGMDPAMDALLSTVHAALAEAGEAEGARPAVGTASGAAATTWPAASGAAARTWPAASGAAATTWPAATTPLVPVAVLCLAGLDLPVDERRLTEALAGRHLAERLLLHNDTMAVLRAGAHAGWGVGVVCGTGINCAGLGPDGATVRFPALGELSGDFTHGGLWLGVRGLGLALRARDGRGEPTVLTERVSAHFGRATPEAVLEAVYTGTLPYGRLAELAEVVLDVAASDPPARQAADLLADEVVALATATIRRLGVADRAVEVVLGGGVFGTSDAGFHHRVHAGIGAVAPGAVFRILDSPPVLGAALLALDALGAEPDALARTRDALAET